MSNIKVWCHEIQRTFLPFGHIAPNISTLIKFPGFQNAKFERFEIKVLRKDKVCRQFILKKTSTQITVNLLQSTGNEKIPKMIISNCIYLPTKLFLKTHENRQQANINS